MQKKNKKKTPLRRSCLHRLKRNWKVFDKHRDFPGIIKAWQHLLRIEIRLWSWVLFCSSLYLGWPVLEPRAQNTPDTVREQPLVSTSQTSSVSRDAALQPHFKAPFHNWVRMQSDTHAFNHSPSFFFLFFLVFFFFWTEENLSFLNGRLSHPGTWAHVGRRMHTWMSNSSKTLAEVISQMQSFPKANAAVY